MKDFEKDFALQRKRIDVEHEEQWRDTTPEIPYLQFPGTWQVKVIPPFGGAFCRFLVKKPSGHEVSVYLDCMDRLGVMGHPYWEVYPHDGDVGRCYMDDTFSLLQMIDESQPD